METLKELEKSIELERVKLAYVEASIDRCAALPAIHVESILKLKRFDKVFPPLHA